MIQLKKLNFEDTNAEYEYIRSVLPDENGFYNDSFGVRTADISITKITKNFPMSWHIKLQKNLQMNLCIQKGMRFYLQYIQTQTTPMFILL